MLITFPFAIVAINILIAVASDFESGIRGAMAMAEFGDRWWLSSENVWLYGGWWNWVNGIAGILPEQNSRGFSKVIKKRSVLLFTNP